MRLILQSSYLTLEYLLWRKYNLSFEKDTPTEFVKVLIVNKYHRNLNARVYIGDKLKIHLKQYGSLGVGSYIENEYLVIDYLRNQKFTDIPNICFFDNDNLILATCHLGDNTIAYQHINNLKVDTTWGEITSFLSKVIVKIKELHKIKIPDYEPKLRMLSPTQIRAIDYTIQAPQYFADLAYLYKKWTPTSLIHFDLNLQNILVVNKDIKIIDWELAMIGDPVWDVALFIVALCKKLGDDNFFTNKEPARFDQVKKVIQTLLENYDVNRTKLKTYLRLITCQYVDTNRKTINRLIGK
ncbi:aminoglycoside phosphotransferase family protein [Runella sp. SP2]|uniref:aminoglycoside phosphotransferase family protein n=1 Tax=Runella sp. SP2 TaxID=2268026 RepID=UPI0013DDD6FF|nr:aminoglycoside phosphotransferase family protein [Runella sp. SP2]